MVCKQWKKIDGVSPLVWVLGNAEKVPNVLDMIDYAIQKDLQVNGKPAIEHIEQWAEEKLSNYKGELLANAIDNNNEVNKQPVLLWAITKGKQIQGEDALAWAVRNNKEVDKQPVLEWAINIDKKAVLKWAVEFAKENPEVKVGDKNITEYITEKYPHAAKELQSSSQQQVFTSRT